MLRKHFSSKTRNQEAVQNEFYKDGSKEAQN